MGEIMKVLIPLDGTPLSETALSCGEQLARERGAEVILLHATQHYASTTPGMPPAVVLELQERDQTKAGDYLSKCEARFPEGQVRIVTALGRPVDEIAAAATRENCDLIIMNSHGREGVVRWLLGSVAEGVLRVSPCPVLLLRPKVPPAVKFQHILVPVDGSQASLQVAHQVGPYLAEGGKVSLLQSSQVATNPANFKMGRDEAVKYRAELEQNLRNIKVEGLTLEAHLVEGEPAEVILSWSQKHGCDLIAMSTHGRSGFRHFFLGSVTEKVARYSHCPVLAFRRARPTA